MALHKIKDFDPDYREHLDHQDIKGLDLYAANEKIGSVEDILVDEEGRFRYLVVNTGLWVLGKKVLFPIGRARIDYGSGRVYADHFTKAQVEALPEFNNDLTLDYDHEEQVRGVYRSTQHAPAAYGVGYAGAETAPATPNEAATLDLEAGYAGYDRDAAGLGAPTLDAAPLDTSAPSLASGYTATAYDRDTYTYDREPELYNLNEENHPNLKLYEERLIANKTRQRTGEVAVGKRVETETARVSVPIEKERVVIERIPGTETAVTAGEANFQAGEVARLEVYEETPDIRKEAFVREEVKVTKVVDHETVNAEESLRREELDINSEGRPVIENNV